MRLQQHLIRALTLSLVLAALAGLAARPGAAADPRIAAKEARARQVLAAVQRLNDRLERAVEAYDGATAGLADLQRRLHENRVELGLARSNLAVAQQHLAARLVQLYTSESDGSTLDVLLGATTLDDLVTRLDANDRVSAQEASVLRQVKTFRTQLQERDALLVQARAAQGALVARRAAFRATIQAGLHEQQRLLSSVRDEIATLRRQEAARQAALEAQAKARQAELARQQALRVGQSVVGVTVTSPGDQVSVVPPSGVGASVVSIAERYLGDPYVWAAAGPSTFDCSGLVMYVYAQVGIQLPHYAASQWNYGVYVSRDQLQPGDLVFFNYLDHVGIYIGNNEFIEAPHTGDVVKISSLDGYWQSSHYYGARRIA